MNRHLIAANDGLLSFTRVDTLHEAVPLPPFTKLIEETKIRFQYHLDHSPQGKTLQKWDSLNSASADSLTALLRGNAPPSEFCVNARSPPIKEKYANNTFALSQTTIQAPKLTSTPDICTSQCNDGDHCPDIHAPAGIE